MLLSENSQLLFAGNVNSASSLRPSSIILFHYLCTFTLVMDVRLAGELLIQTPFTKEREGKTLSSTLREALKLP